MFNKEHWLDLTSMRCLSCRKKCMHIECKFCTKMFCSSCIQPEIHVCEQMNELIEVKRDTLSKQLKIVKDKMEWLQT